MEAQDLEEYDIRFVPREPVPAGDDPDPDPGPPVPPAPDGVEWVGPLLVFILLAGVAYAIESVMPGDARGRSR